MFADSPPWDKQFNEEALKQLLYKKELVQDRKFRLEVTMNLPMLGRQGRRATRSWLYLAAHTFPRATQKGMMQNKHRLIKATKSVARGTAHPKSLQD
jgi:hypothetical protein